MARVRERTAESRRSGPEALSLRTARLEIVPATAAHVLAEVTDLPRFADLVGAVVPSSWPPGEYDRAAQGFFLDGLQKTGPSGVGWFGWYALQVVAPPVTVVGAAGYFGPPTSSGVVQLGYSVCPEWRGRGYATELARALAEHAAAQAGVTEVVAEVAPDNAASLAVLGKCGFVLVGPGEAPGMLRLVWGQRGAPHVAP